MGLIKIMERGGEDLRDYKRALKMAKEGIEMLCDLTEDMEEQYSARDGYGERSRYRGGYSRRDEMDDMEMSERRYRDGRGRYASR